MHDHGDIIIVGHPDVTVRTTYNIWADDGRVNTNGWNYFLEGADHLKIRDTMLFMLYSGNRGIFLLHHTFVIWVRSSSSSSADNKLD